MAIIRVDPDKFESVNVVLVDSDAELNIDAIREIDRWAAEHGFVRTEEYWLRRVRRNDRIYFRGICLRLNDEARDAAEYENQQHAATLNRMPVTPHQPG